MSAIFASLDNRFSVASLRKSSQSLYASTITPDQAAPSQLARMAALSVTLVRIPIILFGIAALNVGWQLMPARHSSPSRCWTTSMVWPPAR